MANYASNGRSASKVQDLPTASLLVGATGVALLTKGTALTRLPRSLWVGTAGTMNFTDAEGTIITNFPVLAGANPILIKALNAGGTADNIWAMY